MSKENYHQLLSDVIENSLLHLYGQVASNDHFVPLAKRNTLLCKYLKPKLKQPEYKVIKGDIKRMVLVGQRKGGDLEAKLNELYTLSLSYQAKANDAQRLYDLLNILLHEHGFDSKLFDESVKAKPDVIYILQDHLENCFEANGKQTAPVSMLIESDRVSALVHTINDTQLFNAELAELKEVHSNKQQAHILLHP
ncbi:hypothetical protein C9J12_27035 [Photobacterium frigidiphilum]|uniref:DUF2913 domain-containing protein n=1 Tax=Photobacterium frigidiphilum TaxID=264736 RepID=A0A2T3J700_9GAMM|nr:DUF2913 family protein [Photobacterium frigidiphilum]PSU44527.1 hypothetical protein C9J12_27035 [Photobacterium frigidiphilum]